jgi:hypothetical protein
MYLIGLDSDDEISGVVSEEARTDCATLTFVQKFITTKVKNQGESTGSFLSAKLKKQLLLANKKSSMIRNQRTHPIKVNSEEKKKEGICKRRSCPPAQIGCSKMRLDSFLFSLLLILYINLRD